jgi:hypothetical protein
MNIEEARKLVGRRVLVNMFMGFTLPWRSPQTILEWKVLTVSPSGKNIKVRGEAGDTCWRPTSEFNIIEALDGGSPLEEP